MGLIKQLFTNCTCPQGRMGRAMLKCMTAYSPEDLKKLLDDAGFIQTEIHRMKPSNATIIGIKA